MVTLSKVTIAGFPLEVNRHIIKSKIKIIAKPHLKTVPVIIETTGNTQSAILEVSKEKAGYIKEKFSKLSFKGTHQLTVKIEPCTPSLMELPSQALGPLSKAVGPSSPLRVHIPPSASRALIPPSPSKMRGRTSPSRACGSPSTKKARAQPSPSRARGPPSPSRARGPPSPSRARGPPSPSRARGPPAQLRERRPPSPSKARGPPSPKRLRLSPSRQPSPLMSRRLDYNVRSESPIEEDIDYKLHMIRKQRLLLEEERKLLVEQRQLQMIKEHGPAATLERFEDPLFYKHTVSNESPQFSSILNQRRSRSPRRRSPGLYRSPIGRTPLFEMENQRTREQTRSDRGYEHLSRECFSSRRAPDEQYNSSKGCDTKPVLQKSPPRGNGIPTRGWSPPREREVPTRRYSPPRRSDIPTGRWSPPRGSGIPTRRFSPPRGSGIPTRRLSPPRENEYSTRGWSPPKGNEIPIRHLSTSRGSEITTIRGYEIRTSRSSPPRGNEIPTIRWSPPRRNEIRNSRWSPPRGNEIRNSRWSPPRGNEITTIRWSPRRGNEIPTIRGNGMQIRENRECSPDRDHGHQECYSHSRNDRHNSRDTSQMRRLSPHRDQIPSLMDGVSHSMRSSPSKVYLPREKSFHREQKPILLREYSLSRSRLEQQMNDFVTRAEVSREQSSLLLNNSRNFDANVRPQQRDSIQPSISSSSKRAEAWPSNQEQSVKPQVSGNKNFYLPSMFLIFKDVKTKLPHYELENKKLKGLLSSKVKMVIKTRLDQLLEDKPFMSLAGAVQLYRSKFPIVTDSTFVQTIWKNLREKNPETPASKTGMKSNPEVRKHNLNRKTEHMNEAARDEEGWANTGVDMWT